MGRNRNRIGSRPLDRAMPAEWLGANPARPVLRVRRCIYLPAGNPRASCFWTVELSFSMLPVLLTRSVRKTWLQTKFPIKSIVEPRIYRSGRPHTLRTTGRICVLHSLLAGSIRVFVNLDGRDSRIRTVCLYHAPPVSSSLQIERGSFLRHHVLFTTVGPP